MVFQKLEDVWLWAYAIFLYDFFEKRKLTALSGRLHIFTRTVKHGNKPRDWRSKVGGDDCYPWGIAFSLTCCWEPWMPLGGAHQLLARKPLFHQPARRECAEDSMSPCAMQNLWRENVGFFQLCFPSASLLGLKKQQLCSHNSSLALMTNWKRVKAWSIYLDQHPDVGSFKWLAEQWWLSLLVFPASSCCPFWRLLSTATVVWLMLMSSHHSLVVFCEPKLPRGRISQWEEQGGFLHTRNTIGS